MPLTFQGIDPSTTGRTGLQAQQYLQGVYGQPLNPNQIGQAHQFLTGIGYGDATGQSAMTGGQWNQLMQEAARLTPGANFQAWSAPAAAPAPTLQPIQFQTPAAPTYEAPTLELPAYQAPEAFEFDAWRPTTAEDLYADPSYQWRLDQGRKALEASAAAKGLLRTGGSMTDLLEYGQDYASNEFGNVDARRRADYSLGYGTARDIYGVNTDEGRYAHETTRDAAQRMHEARVQGGEAEYASRLLPWQAQREDTNRAAELNFDRDYQQWLYERDDAFRRQQADRDETYRNRTYDTDADFRRWLANLQNTQFLSELGLRASLGA